MNRQLRILAAVCLVATAALSVLWTLTAPEFHADPGARLAAVADAGTPATLSVIVFVLSQLPFAVGLVLLAAWLRPASPRLAVIGGALALLGAFGHTVVGGSMLLQPLMVDAPEHREAYAALLGELEDWPPMLPFFAAGLLGTVLGILVLSIAHLRGRAGPRWIAPALWGFLVLEFLGSNLSSYAAYVGVTLYLVALCGLARCLVADAVEVTRDPATEEGLSLSGS